MNPNINVSLSPHIHSHNSISRLMWNVIIAMVPALAVALYVFGLDALYVILLSIVSCVLTEYLINRFLFHRSDTIMNGSAIITAILLAFNLPSILPWWMVVIGSVFAIAVGKMSFGGLGCNIWNPALMGRVFLLLSFPAAMTTWSTEVPSGIVGDAVTGATYLSQMNEAASNVQYELSYMDMLIGNMNGSLGEVGTIAILIGLVYMLAMRVITWHIPVSILVSAAFFSWIFGGNPLGDLLSGGLMLGAVFMATDYVTSPMTAKGQLIYGFFIGLITIIIRRFGAYPEGVSFAILLMNSFTPLINRYCRPAVFGAKERRKAA